MFNDCKLYITIPSMNNLQKVKDIMSNPIIAGGRWNTGISTPYSEIDTLKFLKEIVEKNNKKLWVDIKGRQLRVLEWGNPMYSSIKVNHNIKVDLPAQVLLRNEKPLTLTAYKDNQLFIDPLPKNAVGAGQSINIIGENLEIDGYLTEKDKIYLKACKELNIKNIMASFVESHDDLKSILNIFSEAVITSKIESTKGIKISGYLPKNLMAARDDLYIELNNPFKMLAALKKIVDSDKNAICASRIFTSLEYSPSISFSDYEDLITMYNLGYRNFMLCDNVSNYELDKALCGWRNFIS